MTAFILKPYMQRWYRAALSGGPGSSAAQALKGETDGLALSFTDSFFHSSTGHYGSARVKHPAIPANNYNSHPFGLLTYSGASPKLCRGPDGNLRYGAHNLYLNSEAPANQSISVIAGMTYQISVTGTVSITLSGAATGTVTAGNPISFTAATTTLICGSTSGSGTVHLRRTPSDPTYLKTTTAAVYELPYEWDTDGNPLGIRVEEQRTNLIRYSSDFTQTAWTKFGNPIVTPNAIEAPNGLMDGTLFEYDGSGFFGVFQTHSNAQADTTYTHSFFVKYAAGDGRLRIELNTTLWDDGQFRRVTYNLLTGEWDEELPSGINSFDMIPWGDGWYRIVYSFTPEKTGTGTVFIGTTGSGIGTNFYAWHGQAEVGAFATSPIVTTSSTVTRAADVIGPALDKFPWNEGNGVLTINDQEVEPETDGTRLILRPPAGDTHIQTVKWVPSP